MFTSVNVQGYGTFLILRKLPWTRLVSFRVQPCSPPRGLLDRLELRLLTHLECLEVTLMSDIGRWMDVIVTPLVPCFLVLAKHLILPWRTWLLKQAWTIWYEFVRSCDIFVSQFLATKVTKSETQSGGASLSISPASRINMPPKNYSLQLYYTEDSQIQASLDMVASWWRVDEAASDRCWPD